MKLFKNIFRRKVMKDPVRTMRIDGVKTALTPAPDDAELAAQALLETMCDGRSRRKEERDKKKHRSSKAHDAAYYRQLSDRVREARKEESRLATRYVAYCEQELQSGGTPPTELEEGLFRHQTAAERDGGELKRRWQHCLAECVVRQMAAAQRAAESETKEKNSDHADI